MKDAVEVHVPLLLVVVLVAALSSLAACDENSDGRLSLGGVFISGVITDVSATAPLVEPCETVHTPPPTVMELELPVCVWSNGVLGRIFVEANPGEGRGSKAEVGVTEETKITSERASLTFGDLREGQRVSVTKTDYVNDSDPPQITARTITVIDE